MIGLQVLTRDSEYASSLVESLRGQMFQPVVKYPASGVITVELVGPFPQSAIPAIVRAFAETLTLEELDVAGLDIIVG